MAKSEEGADYVHYFCGLDYLTKQVKADPPSSR